MARRVVLHIGAMKSGTSFIQSVLSANRQPLEAHGVLFPGRRWRNQVSAVRDLMERGGRGQPPIAEDGAWRRLVDEINEWDRAALVSMEFLGPRQPAKIKQILKSFPDAEVEAVLTVRDLTRSIPAMWQESVQNAGVATWEEFLEAVRTEDTRHPAGRNFWRHQSTAAIAERWSRLLGRDRFTLVTVPPPGAPVSLLWERFATAVGFDPAPFDLEVRRNPSIGAASALVMRALNERLAADPLPRQVYSRHVKHALAKEGLATRGTPDPGFGLDEPWAVAFGEREVERLRKLDLRVVGSLEELEPQPVPGVAAGSVSLEEQLEAALDGLERVVRLAAQRRGHSDEGGDE